MNALLLLADGFETVEALQTLDVLTRTHQILTTTASISDSKIVSSSIGVKVEANALLRDVSLQNYDFLILPGGKLGVENLSKSPMVIEAIHAFLDNGKDVHAICAAPSILGALGYLDSLPYTCFPGFQKGNGTYQDTGVVITPHIITGHSMGYTLPFAEAIVAHYLGEAGIKAIEPGVYGK